MEKKWVRYRVRYHDYVNDDDDDDDDENTSKPLVREYERNG